MKFLTWELKIVEHFYIEKQGVAAPTLFVIEVDNAVLSSALGSFFR